VRTHYANNLLTSYLKKKLCITGYKHVVGTCHSGARHQEERTLRRAPAQADADALASAFLSLPPWFGEILLLKYQVCPAVCQSWVLRGPSSSEPRISQRRMRRPKPGSHPRTAENTLTGVEPGSLYTEGDRPDDRVCLRFGVQASARRKTSYRHPLG
jgi:hypothetical protein